MRRDASSESSSRRLLEPGNLIVHEIAEPRDDIPLAC
jgi:hypothetical protein